MVKITIDKKTQKKLFVSNEVIELYDDAGKLLGRILPEAKTRLKARCP